MQRTSAVLGLFFLTLFFIQCQRELGYYGAPDNNANLPTPDPITATVQGNVLDETGGPAPGVVVQAGNSSAVTDGKGYFRIAGASLDRKASLVTAAKAGYFKAYRTFSATSGANQVVIKLLKKEQAGTMSATAGGEVTLSNGSKINLPAAGVVVASSGTAYTGTVTVYATYINPTQFDIAQTIPGSFLANDKNGKRVLLTSYGMLAVELESASGEKLQIKSGAKAALTTAIPFAMQSSAPAAIAMWSVDEKTGVWKEEGTAAKNGNVYVGEVSHFSFWNCDVAANAVILSATMKNNQNEPLVNAVVRIKRSVGDSSMYNYGFTDSLGQVSGYVPGNEQLVLEMLDQCGTIYYSQNIPPLQQSTNLGVIQIANTGNAILTIKGKLLNCNNAAVTNGYVIITYGNQTVHASTNAAGDFQTNFTRCSNSPSNIEVVGIDQAAQQQGNGTSVAVTVPLTNAGTIMACGTSSAQFINYTLDGNNYSFSSTVANDSLLGYTFTDSTQSPVSRTTYLEGSQMRIDKYFSLQFQHSTDANGTYQASEISTGDYGGSVISPFDVIITNFPQSPGQYYEGSFNGNFKEDSTNVTHTLSGTFRLRRVR